ncbi:PrgI family protein [Candidatus Saccharibacteria bacterium]|nr:PrgI family protein [Candidatus Saccharibacteria bacterium]
MAQYKVPQDVEADDKLLGPFTFRQFVYLMVMGGMIALAVALFQIFPFLAILPLPIAIFFAVLALPLKKDQPMETYLAAVVSYHLKPRHRFWNPGQRESTIEITAPKVVEQPRTRNITGEEASTRLSFLANIVDTEGNSLRSSVPAQPMQANFYTENISAPDVLEVTPPDQLTQLMNNSQNSQRAEIINQMRATFAAQNNPGTAGYIPQAQSAPQNQFISPAQAPTQSTPQPVQSLIPAAPAQTPVQPAMPTAAESISEMLIAPEAIPPKPSTPEPAMVARPAPPEEPEVILPTPEELAAYEPLKSPVVITPDIAAMKRAAENQARLAALSKDKELSVATIAKEANRIAKDDEVYISLR